MLESQGEPLRWRLLIYEVPSQPSRKRASVWRELKKVGAMYLRDGVGALPENEPTRAVLARIAARIEEFGGEATVIGAVELDDRRAQLLIDASRREREQEYAALLSDGGTFLKHIEREMRHREFRPAELRELEADLAKLRKWLQQIAERDYFGTPSSSAAAQLLDRCNEALRPALRPVG